MVCFRLRSKKMQFIKEKNIQQSILIETKPDIRLEYIIWKCSLRADDFLNVHIKLFIRHYFFFKLPDRDYS